MSDQQVQILQGKSEVILFRKAKDAGKKSAKLVPYLTSGTINRSRSTNNTETKSGTVHAIGSLSGTASFNFVDAISSVGDDIREAIDNGEKCELWSLRLDRVKDGKYWTEYAQGYVTQDNSTNAPNATATRAVTFTPEGSWKLGWSDMPSDVQQEIDYVFKGVGANDAGEAWTDGDVGAGSNEAGTSTVSTGGH